MIRRAGTTFAGLLLAVLIGVLIGVGGVTFRYAEGLSYMSNDPKACVNCHIMREQFDGWEKASHHAHATCNDCHVPVDFIGKYYTKAEHGWRHSKGFTLNDFHEPIRITPGSARIVQQNCIRCHESLTSEIVGHGRGSESADCIHCHAHVGHGASR